MKKFKALIFTFHILGMSLGWTYPETYKESESQVGVLKIKTTIEVWQHHIEAWESRSLSDIISDYDEQSILILNGKIFQGQASISKVFSSLFSIFDRGENKIDPVIIVDRVVYITWHFTLSSELKTHYGTDTFVIEKGKIKIQTIASPLYNHFPI